MAVFDVTVRFEVSDEALKGIRSIDEQYEGEIDKMVRHFVTDELFNGDTDQTGRYVISLREEV